jgi:Ca-activated chloride channel family protein
MNSLSNFHFLRPAWLALIPVAVWLWWLSRKRLDPLGGWRSLMDAQLLAAMTVGNVDHSKRRSLMLLVAWILGTVSLAGPAWRPEPSPFSDDPVPVMLLLKAGESMQLSDLSPNRMERARLKAVDLAKARGQEPMGLIAYAGSVHFVLPPTRDTSVVGDMAVEISPDIMPQKGDDLAMALKLAMTTLEDSGGSIVVILDTVATPDASEFHELAKVNRKPIQFLAVARENTPEIDSIREAASVLNASVTMMTPDTEDVQSIAKAASGSPGAISAAVEGVCWAEDGWWLVPVLAALSLIEFRREVHETTKEASP